MQVNAVNNFSNINGTSFQGKRKSSQPEYSDNRFDEGRQINGDKISKASKAARNAAIGLMMLAPASSALQSCGDNEIYVDHEHNFKLCCPVDTGKKGDTVYVKEYLPGDKVYIHDTLFKTKYDTIYNTKYDTVVVEKPGKNDTILVEVPGKNDTIIVEKHDTTVIEKPIQLPPDTIWVVPNFESEVVDTLNKDLCKLGIDCEKGLPIQMVFNDEWNVTNNALFLNGRQTSPGRLVYDNTITGWYDDKEYVRAELSVAKGKGLVINFKKARIDGVKPTDDLGWKPFKTVVLQDVGNKLLKLELDENGGLKKYGTITPGDKENSVFNNNDLPNGEVETWRYADWKIKRHDMKLDELYSDYLRRKEAYENGEY